MTLRDEPPPLVPDDRSDAAADASGGGMSPEGLLSTDDAPSVNDELDDVVEAPFLSALLRCRPISTPH